MSIEAIILGAILIIGIHLFNKINEPKKLRDWAQESCSEMRYGEVLVHLSRIRANLEEYKFLSIKEQALLRELENRERTLKGGATPESILEDVQHYALMRAPERALEILGQSTTPKEEGTNEKHKSHTSIQNAPSKPHYQMVSGRWTERPKGNADT